MTEATGLKFSRVWAMPSRSTFNILPIRFFVKRYLANSTVSCDPFARNNLWATYTNDLNPETNAEYHMEAADFVNMLVDKGITADLAIFDPPYSLTQVARSYNDIGLKFKGKENPTGGFPAVKDAFAKLLVDGGYCLSFGWNSVGMGKKHGFELEEILLVCHGGCRNDTICIAERKIAAPQPMSCLF